MAPSLHEIRRQARAKSRQKEEERRQREEERRRERAKAREKVTKTRKMPSEDRSSAASRSRQTNGEQNQDREERELDQEQEGEVGPRMSVEVPTEKSVATTQGSSRRSAATKSSPSSSVSCSQSSERAKKRSSRFLDSDSSDEDLLSISNSQLSKPSKARVCKTISVPKRPLSSVQRVGKRHDNDDESEDEDLLEYAAKMRQQKASVTATKVSSTQETHDTQETEPSDGLALAKSAEKENKRKSQRPTGQPKMAAGDLWDDSDSGGDDELQSKKKKARSGQGLENKRAKKILNRNVDHHDEDGEGSSHDDDDADVLSGQFKPAMENPKFGPFDFEPLLLCEGRMKLEVPASIIRYLPGYQKEGVRFMFDTAIAKGKGAILGDDMGLGKTVQVVSLLAALLEKKGNGLDLLELRRRRRKAEEITAQRRHDPGLLALSAVKGVSASSGEFSKEIGVPAWAPILIVAPPSIIQNWVEDFGVWGHFSVVVYKGTERESSLEKVRQGTAEIMICAKSLFMQENDFSSINSIAFKLAVIDEFHLFKNAEGKLATNLRRVRETHKSVVLGLTGTLMQNDHDELWNLIDLVVENHLGARSDFKYSIGQPIKLARTKDANADAIKLGEEKTLELSKKLGEIFIRRTKNEVLRGDLPQKHEKICFCPLSRLQESLYRHILQQPDFLLLGQAKGPCDCGVNRKFFLEFQQLSTKEQRLEYQRRNKNKIISRGKCCYQIPSDREAEDGISPNAVLWRRVHEKCGNQACSSCPSCIGFSAMSVLYKLSSHAGLLQLKTPPERYRKGSKERKQAEHELELAKSLIPPRLLSSLPGASYYRGDGIMDDHAALSGKMAVLEKLLKKASGEQGRVLLFSGSTQCLDLIQNYIRSEGYSHLRMDGSTAIKKRNELAEEFKQDESIFIFLLSTKAMGLGLNLTSANFVIIYDVEWNPSFDTQATDRAFRIGQDRNVKVFRLVARGTIEEMKYLRQVYKTQLKSETIVDVDAPERDTAARLFRGVQGDKTRKGELFGFANLLNFRDGTFRDYGLGTRYGGLGVHTTENLLNSVRGMSDEEFETIGEDTSMFDDLAKRTVSANDDNSDMEEEQLGVESQVNLEICDNVAVAQALEAIAEEDNDVTSNDESPDNKRLRSKRSGQSKLHLVMKESPKRGKGKPQPRRQLAKRNSPPKLKDSNGRISSSPSGRGSSRGRSLNVTLVGTTTHKISSGESKPTTFSARDLPTPRAKAKAVPSRSTSTH